MNHLAHCFLSFGDEDLLLGNFIGDYIKGKDWNQYPERVQKGILLHRKIDAFTDYHPVTNKSVVRLRQFARRYSPPVVDILYDYTLSTSWHLYSTESLPDFVQKTYQQLENRKKEMPTALQERLPRMLEGRFLERYGTKDGMAWVLEKFSSRLPIDFDPAATLDFFFENLSHFSQDFNSFFPELVEHARENV